LSKKFACALSFLLAVPAAYGAQPEKQVEQPAPAPAATEGKFAVASARAELEALYRSLQSAHYKLYVHRPKSEYDAYFKRISAQLSEPMSKLDLVRAFQPFVAFGRIGHARIEFPVADYIAAARAGGTVLPFDIRVDGSRVFVTHSYLKDSKIKPGVELLAFDDQPIAKVVDDVSRYVSGERPYMVHAQLERFFPRWLWLARGEIRALRVSGRSSNGDQFVEAINGLPIGEVEPEKSGWTEALSTREVRMLDAKTAYLRPGAFYNIEGGESMDAGAFRKFVDDAFGKIKEAKAQSLIIDLRDNPGGDNSFSDPMVAWFASRPFRFSDNFSIKASPEIRQQFEKQMVDSKDGDGIIAQMHRAMKGKRDGTVVKIELPKVAPRPDRFQGRVFLLVNRHSYSNAASLAGMVQDYGFAKVVGEETADLPTSYASSAQFALPASGIEVTYPKGYFVRPNGDRKLKGVVPDFPIPAAVFVDGHDAVLSAAVKIASNH
jgi:C-terminal processing protease CtpA/Prc